MDDWNFVRLKFISCVFCVYWNEHGKISLSFDLERVCTPREFCVFCIILEVRAVLVSRVERAQVNKKKQQLLERKKKNRKADKSGKGGTKRRRRRRRKRENFKTWTCTPDSLICIILETNLYRKKEVHTRLYTYTHSTKVTERERPRKRDRC